MHDKVVRWYLVGFRPEHGADYEREVVEWLRKAGRLEVERYAPDTAPVMTFPAFNPPAVVAPSAASQGTAFVPPAPFEGASVVPYVTPRGTGFRCWDKALGLSWLYNNHAAMANTWKAKVANVWTPIAERPAMLARVAALSPVTQAPAALPFTVTAAPAPARRTRKR